MHRANSKANGLTATTLKKLLSRANSKAIALIVLGYSILLGIFYAPFLLGDRCFFYADTTFFLEPHAKFISSMLRQGQFPIWNPLNYCGMPEIAVTFPSLFYPPDYLLFFLDFSKGLALSMMFHLTVAAVGFYLLAKSFRYGSAEALAGAMVFSLSGYMFSLTANISLIAGLAWLPLSLWSLREIETQKESKKFLNFIRAGLCVLLLVLSGRPEIVVPSVALLILYCVLSAVARVHLDKISLGSSLMWQARALFLALTLSLPCTLPVMEWLSISRRATGLGESEVFMFSAHWYDLISMILGPSLGDLRLQNAVFRPLVSAVNIPPYVSCAFVGPLTLCLSIWGLSDHRWRWRWLALILLLTIILGSLGDSTPIMPALVHGVSALGFVRFPIKLLGFAILCLAFMTSQGFATFKALRVPIRSSAIFWLVISITGITCHILSSRGFAFFPFVKTTQPIDLILKAQSLIGTSILWAGLWGLSATLLGYLIVKKKLSVPFGTAMLISALLGTLLLNAFSGERQGAVSDFWRRSSTANTALRALQQNDGTDPAGRIFNVCFERFTLPEPLRPNNVRADVDDFQYYRQVLKQNSNLDYLVPEAFGFEGTSRGDYYYVGMHSYLESSQSSRPEITPSSDLPLARFCAITSTNYVLTQKYRKIGHIVPVTLLSEQLFHLAFEDDAMNLRIYKVLSSLPRCYVTHNWQWIDSHNTMLNSIVYPKPTKFNLFTSTIIESDLSNSRPLCDPNAKLITSDDEVKVLRAKCSQITINVKTASKGYLVLSDQVYPGWHAYVDSKRTFIYTANGFSRAIEILPGAHVVEFKYEPESLTLGCIIAVLSTLLVSYLFLKQHSTHG